MASDQDKELIYTIINDYIECLKKNDIKLWRLYLYGSIAQNRDSKYSDIDLAVFLDKDDIDGFEDDALLMKLTRGVDLRIEPHSFARTDFDESDPFIREIITTGERIL
jgi:predicted nucleotidyltransferase